MARWILCAGLLLVAGTVRAEERATGHETNARIAAARCAVAKRCWSERAASPCDQADKIKAESGGEARTGLYLSDMNQCLDSVEKADCSKIQMDLIRYMTSADNAACKGYRDYYQHAGRYAAPTK